MQPSGMEVGNSSACSGQHDDSHNRHPADFTLSIFSSTEEISQYQNLNIENSNEFIRQWSRNLRISQTHNLMLLNRLRPDDPHNKHPVDYILSTFCYAACSHFFIEENRDKVKSAGCLLWGSSGCRICRSRLSTQQNTGNGKQLLVCFNPVESTHNLIDSFFQSNSNRRSFQNIIIQ